MIPTCCVPTACWLTVKRPMRQGYTVECMGAIKRRIFVLQRYADCFSRRGTPRSEMIVESAPCRVTSSRREGLERRSSRRIRGTRSPRMVTRQLVSRDPRGALATGLRRRSRRRTCVFATSLLVFLVALGGQWALMSMQVKQIRLMVDRQPTRVMKNLDEVTRELCHAPPADYFVQQLTIRRASGRVSLLNGF